MPVGKQECVHTYHPGIADDHPLVYLDSIPLWIQVCNIKTHLSLDTACEEPFLWEWACKFALKEAVKPATSPGHDNCQACSSVLIGVNYVICLYTGINYRSRVLTRPWCCTPEHSVWSRCITVVCRLWCQHRSQSIKQACLSICVFCCSELQIVCIRYASHAQFQSRQHAQWCHLSRAGQINHLHIDRQQIKHCMTRK